MNCKKTCVNDHKGQRAPAPGRTRPVNCRQTKRPPRRCGTAFEIVRKTGEGLLLLGFGGSSFSTSSRGSSLATCGSSFSSRSSFSASSRGSSGVSRSGFHLLFGGSAFFRSRGFGGLLSTFLLGAIARSEGKRSSGEHQKQHFFHGRGKLGVVEEKLDCWAPPLRAASGHLMETGGRGNPEAAKFFKPHPATPARERCGKPDEA